MKRFKNSLNPVSMIKKDKMSQVSLLNYFETSSSGKNEYLKDLKYQINDSSCFSPFSVSKRELSTLIECASLPEYDLPLVHNLIVKDVIHRKKECSFHVMDRISQTNYQVYYPDCPFQVKIGDPVIIIGEHISNRFQIDQASDSYFIYYPREHISITSLANTASNQCIRMAYLKDRLQTMTSLTLPMIVGSLSHFLFDFLLSQHLTISQATCEQNLSQSCIEITKSLNEAALRYLQSDEVIVSLFCANVAVDQVLIEAEKLFPSLIKWAKLFSSSKLDIDNSFILHDTLIRFEIIATEEYIEDNIYGLKGKIDITAKVVETKSLIGGPCCFEVGDIVPIEIKTGKTFPSGSLEHRAQSMLYSMVIENRYNTKINKSILLYIQDQGLPVLVSSNKFDRKALLQIRNSMIYSLNDTSGNIPDFSQSPNSCRFCPVSNACHLHALKDNQTHPHSSVTPNKLNLEIDEIVFFKQWFDDINLEAANSMKKAHKSNIGLVNEESNESVIKSLEFIDQKMIGLNWILKFERIDKTKNISTSHAFSSNTLITENSFIIGKLKPKDHNSPKFMFMGIVHKIDMEKGILSVKIDSPLSYEYYRQEFDLKLYTSSSTQLLPVSFLTELFIDNSEHASKIRNLIIRDHNSDICSNQFNFLEDKLLSDDINRLFHSTMCQFHVKAINKCINVKDYTLLWGLPGTGKTTTISAIIHIFNKLNKKILITSHTNAAVDNILLKLIELDVDFLRMGKNQAIHNDVQPYSFESLMGSREWKSEDFEKVIHNKKIIASTCIGMKNQIFERIKYFDVCIVDEATQVNLPLILGSLKYCNTFILVGDHYQMSPLVISCQCKYLQKSLFQMLMINNKKRMVSLDEQFRMHPLICELSSKLFYDNRLQASDMLPELNEKLQLPDILNLKLDSRNKSWLKKSIYPKSHPVIFIDSSIIKIHDIPFTQKLNPCININEVSAVMDLINILVNSGLDQKDIGVLSVYNDQVNFIRFLTQQRFPDVEVHTIDRFQGRDKLCIILSLVTKAITPQTSIINDPKRLNVALTRARKKLIILGNYLSLKENSYYKRIFSILTEHDALVTK